jgi:hypothetical protein
MLDLQGRPDKQNGRNDYLNHDLDEELAFGFEFRSEDWPRS